MTTKAEYKKYRVYGTVGMVALFLMGALVGFILNGSDRINHSTMSKNDCNSIAGRIIDAARNNQPDLIEQLNKVYSENCLDRVFEQPKQQPKVETKKLPESNCEAVEELVLQELEDENSTDWKTHLYNSEVYQKLIDKGCGSNKEKYWKLKMRSLQLLEGLNPDYTMQNGFSDKTPACQKIETVLKRRLYEFDNPSAPAHIDNAKIYANLSERGCPENSGKYKDLAKQELEIARALNDDDMEDRHEATEIVETYKRIQMQAEAERMIEKAKKLTNPAIDFIIQLEKIIDED